jgi:16S rRNA (cytosine967-C5)-methyltransferase
MIDIRLEAYKIIVKVLSKQVFSDKILTQMNSKIKNAGEDAQLLYALVKGTIKMQRQLDFIALCNTDESRWNNTNLKFKALIYLGLYQIIYHPHVPDHATVNETVNIAKKLFGDKIAGFVNAVLRSFLRSPQVTYPEDEVSNLAVRYSFPDSLISSWLSYWGKENTTELCEYFNTVPQLSFRTNFLATNPDKLKTYFERRNIEVFSNQYAENIFVTKDASAVLNDIAFTEGYYSVQDPSAALVVQYMKPGMNESVLDLFAAPGGKATYISELMINTGEIIAVDKSPLKIKKLKQSMERLKLTNIKPIAMDAFSYGPVAPAFDQVLLDVPCSGWGVLQKKAELRWQAHQDIDNLLKLQENALKLGALFTREGGFLTYSTCTMNEQENEKQIEKFLGRNKCFQLVPAEKFIQKSLTENGFLKTLPFAHKMDGAFAAKLQKI